MNVVHGNDLCIRNFELSISYDTTIVDTNGTVQPTIYTPRFTTNVITSFPDSLIISGTSSQCIRLYGPGSLFHVFFDAQGSESKVSSLEIRGIIWGDSVIDRFPVVMHNGSLSVGGNGFRGDVNVDGNVNLADAGLALEIANLSITPTPQQEAACDLNGDRVCNAADSSLIICHIATQNSTECAQKLKIPQVPVEVKIGSVFPVRAMPQKVTIPIEINQAPDFAGGQFSFTYDANKMSATGAVLTSLTNGFELRTDTSQAGLLQVSLARDTPIGANGPILELAFTVDEAPSSVNFGSVRLNDANGRDFFSSALQRKIVPYNNEHLLYLPAVMR